MRTGGAIFGAVGFGLLAIGLAIVGWIFYFRASSQQVMGTIVAEVLTPLSDGNAYCPVVRYTTRNGETLEHHSNVCSWPAANDVGDQVKIYYDPLDPAHVQMDSFFGTWFAPGLLIFMGVIFAGVSVPMLIPDFMDIFSRLRSG